MYNEKDIISKWNAEMYERSETDIDDVELAIDVIGPEAKHVLEIACGSGRFLIPMAEAGHDVVGLDFDEFMLEKIETKIKEEKRIKWYKADMIQEKWGTGFDVVVLAANILNNIVSDMEYEKAQELLIQKAAAALVSGGHVYIDCGYTLHPEKWFDNPDANVIWEGTDGAGNTGKMMLLNSTFNKETRMIRFIRRFELTLADGQNIVQEIPSEKYFATLDQIHKWLEDFGFVIEKEFGDYCGNPVSESTSRAIIWAKKIN